MARRGLPETKGRSRLDDWSGAGGHRKRTAGWSCGHLGPSLSTMDLSPKTTHYGGWNSGQVVGTDSGRPGPGVQVGARFLDYTDDRREQWVGVVLLDGAVVYELSAVHADLRLAAKEARDHLSTRLAALLMAS